MFLFTSKSILCAPGEEGVFVCFKVKGLRMLKHWQGEGNCSGWGGRKSNCSRTFPWIAEIPDSTSVSHNGGVPQKIAGMGASPMRVGCRPLEPAGCVGS